MPGTWGFKGKFAAALEFPDGDPEDVAPSGRARVRYSRASNQMQVSLSGGPYGPVGFMGDTAALTQPAFFIDAANGNDANSGATAATAIRTFAEWSRRIATGRVTVAQTVTLLTDLDEPEYVINGSFPLGVTIQGQRTALYTGSVTGAQAWNQAASPVVDGQITDAALPGTWSDSGPGGTTLIGRMVVLTSGPNVGLTGWLLADLGAKTARVSLFASVFTFATGNAAIGDGFEVVALTRLLTGTVVIQNQDPAGYGLIDFEDIQFEQAQPFATQGGSLFLGNSKLLGDAATIADADFGAGSCLFALTSRVAFADCENCFLLSCSFFGRMLVDQGTFMRLLEINPSQRDNAGTLMTVESGAVVSVQGSFGGIGTGVAASDAIVVVHPMGLVQVIAGAKVWGLGITNGYGVWLDSMAAAMWPNGAAAATHYDFDGAGFDDFLIGGVASTAAALGMAGSITAANNAAAIPFFGGP